jgi:hypothetical protein
MLESNQRYEMSDIKSVDLVWRFVESDGSVAIVVSARFMPEEEYASEDRADQHREYVCYDCEKHRDENRRRIAGVSINASPSMSLRYR